MKQIYLLFLFIFTISYSSARPTGTEELTPVFIQEKPQINDIKIFPNPAKGNEVTILTKKNITVEVYDVLGKKVKVQKITLNQNKLNIADLKKGIYLLKFKTDSAVITKKLIRQ